MVNYHDPVVVQQDASIASKIWQVVAGLYFWEFVTTLDYEWSVIRRHRPFRWTIWIYSTTRISALMSITLTLVGDNVTARINCEAESIFLFFFGYLAIVSASLLIVLRILAIWNRKKIIIVIAVGTWGINVIFQIQSIVRIRTTQLPAGTCLVDNMHISELNILVTLATDVILLLIMSFGLLRLGYHDRGTFGLGRLLWKQGVVWLLVATIAEALPGVFLCLNLNDPFDYMFLPASMVTLSIAATRIHRSLTDYASFGSTEHSERGGRIEWKKNTVPTTLGRMEMAVNRTSDQDQTPQRSQKGSFAITEGQVCEKRGGQYMLDENSEKDVGSEKQVLS